MRITILNDIEEKLKLFKNYIENSFEDNLKDKKMIIQVN